MLTYPNFDPVALQLGPLSIHWYGITYLVAFGAAWWLARRRAAQSTSTWSARDVDDFVFFAMLGTIIGGRIGYVLVYGLSYWQLDPWYPVKVWDGGMSFHGGLLGVLVAIGWFAISRGRHVFDVFDFGAPLPGIGICAVRIGNFINGELWGAPTTVPWGMLVSDQPGGPLVARHPSQLYEAALEGLLLFIVLWWFSSRPRPRYAVSALFLLCYSIARIAVEFVRVPDAQLGYLAGGWLTMGQLLSLPMLFGGVVLAVIAWRGRVPSGNYRAAA